MNHANLYDQELHGLEEVLSTKQLKRLERKLKQSKKKSIYNSISPVPSTNNIKNILPRKEPLSPKTDKQRELIRAIIETDQIFCTGSAGTGKTYVSTSMAADMFMRGEYKKIVVTRPTVPTGESIGFLPGEVNDKMAYWLAPILSVLRERLGGPVYECQIKLKNIEIIPFEMIRGYSLNDCIVLVDESQNMNIACAKSIVTRIGVGSKLILMGDTHQKDLTDEESGLVFLLQQVSKRKSLQQYTSIIEFKPDDIVRHGLVKEWVKCFDSIK